MTGLKKSWALQTSNLSAHDIVLAHIDRTSTLPITDQADLLGISRSSVYYQPVAPNTEDFMLMNQIDRIYTEFPYYGYRRITKQLHRDGYKANHKRVLSLMHDMGIEAIYPKPNLSKNSQPHPAYPYLLRGVTITAPNQVWGTDITYIRMHKGFVYLAAFMDWYSRYVLSW